MFVRHRVVTSCLAVASVFVLSCGRPDAAVDAQHSAPGTEPARVELTVYAAASTREALQALAPDFEREHAVALVFNFGSSGDLAQQIIAAGKADVFLSAGGPEMDRVAAAGLVVLGTRRVFLSNQLVVIEHSGAPSIFTAPFDTTQLASDRVKRLSLANVGTVPAGRYARNWLESEGVWGSVESRILPAVDVRAALAAVESGGAEAGIVYRTDVAHSTRARTVFAVPIEEGPKIRYPIAVLSPRPHEAQARQFAEYAESAAGRAAFEHFGFVYLPASSETAR